MHGSFKRASALATGLLLTAAALSVPAASAESAPAATPVDDATFTWGLSGYAQKGIFGPWTYQDITGNATQLKGSVSGGDQSEYAVEPVPATSMPDLDGKTPNAIRFVDGTGEVDGDGTSTISWTGSYTVNAYPANYGAPDEIYSDPELTVDADGSGEVTMDVTIGAGEDQSGDPIPESPLGRITLMTFAEGSVDNPSAASYRVAPDYQGVEIDPGDGATQTRNCTSNGGATGWWGAWPEAYVQALPAAIRPHFYSSGCGGLQDNKPALPFDITIGEQPAAAPKVTVSSTRLPKTGKHRITVKGTGFDPANATGTRPPLAGKAAGAYVVFGRFAKNWKPSDGAGSDARPAAVTRWAVLAEDMATVGGPGSGAVKLRPNGSFTAKLTVSKKKADEAAAGAGRYGVYTYAGSGAVEASYETATPVTFVKTATKTAVRMPAKRVAGRKLRAKVRVKPAAGQIRPAGTVRVTKAKSGKVIAKKRLGPKGRLTVKLPKLAVGKHRLRFAYTGNGTFRVSKATRTVRIRRR